MEDSIFNIPFIGDDTLAINTLDLNSTSIDTINNRLVAVLNKEELIKDSVVQLIPSGIVNGDL